MPFIEVHMFREQKTARNATSAPLAPTVAFLQWKEGYIVCSKTGDREQYTIKKIKSKDGCMSYQDCTVELANAADETRLVKGTTLQSGYSFVSKGDREKDEPASDTLKDRDDLAPMSIAVDGIREFYPRKYGKEGTRIILKDKTAYVVQESYDEVNVRIKQACASRITSRPLDQILGPTENVGSI